MTKLTYTKEVTYEFEYLGKFKSQYHFTDNIEGRRYVSGYEDDVPKPLRFHGTGSDHKTIKAELKAVDHRHSWDIDLLYFLPDVSIYVLANTGEMDGVVSWGFKYLN